MAMQTRTATISETVFLSVASGIENELKVRKGKGKREKLKGGILKGRLIRLKLRRMTQ